MAKITVLGAGAWGSTMAQVLADGANDVLLWGRREEVVAEINTSHTNTKYLGSQVLPTTLKATSDINEAIYCVSNSSPEFARKANRTKTSI